MKHCLVLVLTLLAVGCGSQGTPTVPLPTSSQAIDTETVTETPTDPGPALTEPATKAPLPTATKEAAGQAAVETVQPEKKIAEISQAQVLNQVLFGSDFSSPDELLEEIRASGDTRYVAGLIDTLRYQWRLQEDLAYTLNELTGADLSADWGEWVEWAGKHPEIESFEGYAAWKANLFAQIDPRFLRFVHRDMAVDPDSRVEEIVWGGVRVDGIPALDNPAMINPDEADYLIPEERVFGVSINGDTRAYPARFLDWHEMFNDIVGGEPVSLAY